MRAFGQHRFCQHGNCCGCATPEHTHKWGPWESYSPICSEPLAPMEKAVCACGADKVRRAETKPDKYAVYPLPPEEEEEERDCAHESWEVLSERGAEGGGWLKQRRCAHCSEPLEDVVEAEPHWDLQPAPPIPRPPYAVAYAVQGGALYEVALPGDATAAAEGGRLVITHSGMPVTGIVRVAPMRIEEA